MHDPHQLGSDARGSSWAAAGFACTLLLACGAFDADRLGRRPDPAGTPIGGSTGRSGSDGDVTTGGGRGGGPGGAAGTGGVGGQPSDGTRDAAMPRDDGGASDAAADAGAEQDASTAPDAGPDGGTCTTSNVTDYCSELPALDDPPVLDGVLDCGPSLRALALTGWKSAAAQPSGLTAKLAAAYRPDGLYVYVEVHGQAPAPHPSDALIYCGDALELYVDADGTLASDGAYDAPGTMQLIVAAPASEGAPNPHAERFLQGATQGAWSGAYKLTWLADGYALEAFIVAADLGLASWSPSGMLGLNLVLDVAGPSTSPDLGCGLQLGQYFWRLSAATPSSCNGEPWCDTRAFCVTELQ